MTHQQERSGPPELGEAQPQAQSALKRVGLFLAMVLGTGALGAALATLVARFGWPLLLRGELPGLADIMRACLLLVAAGHLAGVVLGMVAADRLTHRRGSLPLGIAGSILGVGPVVGLYFLTSDIDLPVVVPVICLGVGPPLLGTAGFHLGRRRHDKS